MTDYPEVVRRHLNFRIWLAALPVEVALTVAFVRVPFWLFYAWRRGVDHRSLSYPPEEK